MSEWSNPSLNILHPTLLVATPMIMWSDLIFVLGFIVLLFSALSKYSSGHYSILFYSNAFNNWSEQLSMNTFFNLIFFVSKKRLLIFLAVRQLHPKNYHNKKNSNKKRKAFFFSFFTFQRGYSRVLASRIPNNDFAFKWILQTVERFQIKISARVR